MDQTLDDILKLLKLERLEVNLFRGQSPNEQRQRVFGGQVLGQALSAASYTVDNMTCHSFHSYFLRPGDPIRRLSMKLMPPAMAEVLPHAVLSPFSTASRFLICRPAIKLKKQAASIKSICRMRPIRRTWPAIMSLRKKIADKVPEDWRDSFCVAVLLRCVRSSRKIFLSRRN
jgi:hypothetical protein